jgi:hypothetical protein
MRPAVPFMPGWPLKPAGMRMEPPPSPPDASVTRPPATAAALPPEEPPAVRPICHGLWVTPFSLLIDTFSPPNSEAVVSPIGTTPPSCSARSIEVSVYSATRSANTSDASVSGQPV